MGVRHTALPYRVGHRALRPLADVKVTKIAQAARPSQCSEGPGNDSVAVTSHRTGERASCESNGEYRPFQMTVPSLSKQCSLLADAAVRAQLSPAHSPRGDSLLLVAAAAIMLGIAAVICAVRRASERRARTNGPRTPSERQTTVIGQRQSMTQGEARRGQYGGD